MYGRCLIADLVAARSVSVKPCTRARAFSIAKLSCCKPNSAVLVLLARTACLLTILFPGVVQAGASPVKILAKDRIRALAKQRKLPSRCSPDHEVCAQCFTKHHDDSTIKHNCHVNRDTDKTSPITGLHLRRQEVQLPAGLWRKLPKKLSSSSGCSRLPAACQWAAATCTQLQSVREPALEFCLELSCLCWHPGLQNNCNQACKQLLLPSIRR